MMRIFLNFALWSIRREKNNLRFYSEQDDKGLNIIRSDILGPRGREQDTKGRKEVDVNIV